MSISLYHYAEDQPHKHPTHWLKSPFECTDPHSLDTQARNSEVHMATWPIIISSPFPASTSATKWSVPVVRPQSNLWSRCVVRSRRIKLSFDRVKIWKLIVETGSEPNPRSRQLRRDGSWACMERLLRTICLCSHAPATAVSLPHAETAQMLATSERANALSRNDTPCQ